MLLLFFVALIIVGRCGGSKKSTVKIHLDTSTVAHGSVVMACGCRLSKEEIRPCQAHRLISSAEGN